MIPAGDLAAMRTQQERTMVNAARIDRKSVVSDGAGGETETWATHIATVKCRTAPFDRMVLGSETVVSSRFTEQTLWTVTFPVGTAIITEDRIITSGVTFEIREVLGPHTYDTALRVLCTKVA